MTERGLLEQFAELVAAKVAERVKPDRNGHSRKRLLTSEEAGEYIGRSPGAVLVMARRGDLKAVRAGRRVHFAVQDLDKWIERHRDA